MKDQLQEAVDMFEDNEGEKVSEEVNAPTQSHFREVKMECAQLGHKKTEVFYSVVTKLLWMMKRSCPDLETAIGFICTRVAKSDEDDWKKLRRMIAYMKCTIDDAGII